MASIGAVVTVTIAAVYSLVCWGQGRSLQVALVSGIPKPYTVQLNGQSYSLNQKTPVLVKLTQGDFALTGAPGSTAPQQFTASTPFWSRPLDKHVLVVNPDALAVVYRESASYSVAPSASAQPNQVDLFVNQVAHYLPAADYFFEDFPRSVSMPSGSGPTTKTRFSAISNLPVDNAANLIEEKLGYDALAKYISRRAAFEPESEVLQRIVYAQLKPADARRIFESHLTDRPILVEWHRAYQFFMDNKFHEVDVASTYRKWMESDPDDGVMAYLYGRLFTDPAISRPLYEKAMKAKRPSPYACYALAVEEYAESHYGECLELLERAEQGGMVSSTLHLRKHDALLAAGRVDDAIAEVARSRAKLRMDASLFAEELMLKTSIQRDRVAALRAISAFVNEVKKEYGGGDVSSLENWLNARLAYALGEEKEFSAIAAKLNGSNNGFEAAISRRDHKAAAKAVEKEEQLPDRYHWTLMLAAHATGDRASEELYFQKALHALENGDSHSRAVAAHIKEGTTKSHREILHTENYGQELRVLFTAMGVHFPEQRAAYFARAAELDRDPEFPHLLLQSVRSEPVTTTNL